MADDKETVTLDFSKGQPIDTETVSVQLPSGEVVDVVVPRGASNEEIRRGLLKVAPEEFSAGPPLTRQDISDLVEIRSKLPQDDPRTDKIDRLLFRQNPEQWSISQLPGVRDNFPGTFGGATQAFAAAGGQAKTQLLNSNSNPLNAPQLKPNPISRTNANMAAALAGQRQLTPEDQERFESGKQSGFISGATQVGMGALGPLTGPTAVAATEGTGVLDSAGNEIMREVTKYGPSLGRQGLQATVSWISRHPALAAVAYEGARRAGVPLPNIIGWLSKAAGETGVAK